MVVFNVYVIAWTTWTTKPIYADRIHFEKNNLTHNSHSPNYQVLRLVKVLKLPKFGELSLGAPYITS